MARILIGNIRGPKGDKGEIGQTGPMGPTGPQGPLPPLVANYLQSEEGAAALDAIMGKKIDERIKELAEQYTQLNSEITTLNSSIEKTAGEATGFRVDQAMKYIKANWSSFGQDAVKVISYTSDGPIYCGVVLRVIAGPVEYGAGILFGYKLERPIYFYRDSDIWYGPWYL